VLRRPVETTAKSGHQCGLVVEGASIVSRHRAANALERKLADRLDRYGLLDSLPNARADENLTGLGFIAKA